MIGGAHKAFDDAGLDLKKKKTSLEQNTCHRRFPNLWPSVRKQGAETQDVPGTTQSAQVLAMPSAMPSMPSAIPSG